MVVWVVRVEMVGGVAWTWLFGLVAAWVLALAPLAYAASEPADADSSPVVIWLSFDGVRHDQPDRVAVPALERIERDGVRAGGLKPVRPSTTFPNHVSQATCASPVRHGIVGNRFRDRERGRFAYEADASWIRAEPLWVTAERQGVRAASYFWVGSETPWRGISASDRLSPFDESHSEATKLEQILAWLDRAPTTRPGLIMSWWRGSDGAGHRHGPDSSAVTDALLEQGAVLQRLLAALDERNAWSYTTLIVTSDHGMAHGRQAIDLVGALGDAGIDAEIDSGGAVAYVHVAGIDADPSLASRARGVLEAQPGHRIHSADEAIATGAWGPRERIGDFVAIARPPYFYTRGGGGLGWFETLRAWFDGGRGIHGYDPRMPEMHGIFYALGRGVPAGVEFESVSALDVAPTVSRLLGIDPPADCEGKALPGFGESGHAPGFAR